MVIAILSLLIALAAMAAGNIQSMRLASSAQSVQRTIQLAQSEAVSRNLPVEVRFCRGAADEPLQTLQLLAYGTDGRIDPLGRPVKLHESVLIEINATRSTLFSSPNAASGSAGSSFAPNALPQNSIPSLGDYEVFSFFVRPDGTTSLPWANSNFPFITLRENKNLEQAPTNFVAIQIDPVTSKATIFQP